MELSQNYSYVSLNYLLGFPNFNNVHFSYFIYFLPFPLNCKQSYYIVLLIIEFTTFRKVPDTCGC